MIGQREALAAAHVIARELERVDAVARFGLDGNEPHEVELARRAKQHAAAMRGPTFGRMRRPCRVAPREVEIGSMRGLVLLPARDRLGKRQLTWLTVERHTETRLQLRCAAPRRRMWPQLRPCARSSPCAARTCA